MTMEYRIKIGRQMAAQEVFSRISAGFCFEIERASKHAQFSSKEDVRKHVLNLDDASIARIVREALTSAS